MTALWLTRHYPSQLARVGVTRRGPSRLLPGEIFEKHIGENTPIGLSRGLNAQWTDGGLLYAPPFR